VILHRSQYSLPRRSEHRIRPLGCRERRFVRAVFLHQDVRCSVDVEFCGHAEALAFVKFRCDDMLA
jgi:hypothetical protein